jgi:nitrous oxidase accessory protein NosD
MNRHFLVMPLALLTIAATPAPPAAKVFSCTADGSKTAFRIRIGAGEYSTFDSDKAQWNDNSCAEAKDCKFKGAAFTASFGPNFFTYNRTTAHYVMADIFGDVTDHGKCVPE